MGYTDEKVARLTREAIAQGWNHFKGTSFFCRLGLPP